MSYNEVKLAEVASYISRGITPSYTDADGLCVINQKCIRNGSLSLAESRLHNESKKIVPTDKIVQPMDILVNSTGTGTLGRVAQVTANIRATVDSHVTIVRPSKEVDALFLGYAVKWRKPFIEALAEGSTGQTELSRFRLGDEITIPLPSLVEQQQIAGILYAIDCQINTNSKINDNLQQQALAIFQQEFLREGELPDGWTSGSLLDIANYLNGLAMQKFRPADGESGLPVLKIKELRQGSCDASSELCSPSIKPEYIVHDGDVIFSWSGSLLVDLWCGGTCGLNQHLFKVTSVKYPKWFYYAWTAHHLARFVAIAADKATTMGHIKREELAKAEVVIPDAASMERIGGILQPMYDIIISNRIENRKLAALRDTILPQLMSGELDVSDLT